MTQHIFSIFFLPTYHIGIPSTVPTCAFLGGASAKDQAENQFLEKRYICVTLLLGFPFQENLITSFHLFTNVETLHQD